MGFRPTDRPGACFDGYIRGAFPARKSAFHTAVTAPARPSRPAAAARVRAGVGAFTAPVRFFT
ncbi:hypothetical protein GCM10007904_16620 [Oharaeibacter diazotrophicus]|nr:hypothetical protein GCM10007904_16620 [Oharaeibacter diazotrophicus]